MNTNGFAKVAARSKTDAATFAIEAGANFRARENEGVQ